MRLAVLLFVPALFSTALLAGCSNQRSTQISFVLAPDPHTLSVQVECESSSTGVCHFAFHADNSQKELKLTTGETATVQNISADTKYCGEASKPALATCQFRAVGAKRHSEEKKWSSDKAEI